ncbi:MAG: FAD-binding oxidoreductase [Alphaproteobacteria bacterium]|nr:FAD-binding oxidoreductase [Alphaproteobacteria bacterium]
MNASAERSLWAATADPAPVLPALARDIQADVAIVGGGYTGLSTAYHLALGGVSSVVIEGQSIGWGASGRNGGFVSTRFRASLPAILVRHGRDVARRMHALGQEAVDCVEEMAADLDLGSAAFGRYGNLTAAYDARGLARLHGNAAWLRKEMGETTMRPLSREEITAAVGSQAFVGGTLNEAGAAVHPLNFVRGLARGAAARGVEIYERTRATAIREVAGGVVVETTGGTVRAGRVVIATNAYTDAAARGLRSRVIPFPSAVIATARLPPGLLRTILPGGRLCSDSKRVLRWFRIMDDRLVFGGRGAFGQGASQAAYRRLAREMTAIFPAVAGHAVEFRWSGLVAMTLDALPHIGREGERTFYAMGYNGTGVAMSNLLGRYLAKMIREEPVDMALLAGEHFRAVPMPMLRRPAIKVAAAWQQFLDGIGR